MCTEQRRTTKPHCGARLSSDPSDRSRRVFQAEEATGATISYRKRALRRGQDRLYPIHPGAVRILHCNSQINQARESKMKILKAPSGHHKRALSLSARLLTVTRC